MTELRQAPCGHGYDGKCCCTCALQLVAEPRCACLGGPGAKCKGNLVKGNKGALGALANEFVDEAAEFVCLAFAHDGIAITNWTRHGCCEMWSPREGYVDDNH